jgi:hypothetical protein
VKHVIHQAQIAQPIRDEASPGQGHMEDKNLGTEWDAEIAEEQADRRRKAEPAPRLSRKEFTQWRSPRTGEDNPTRVDNPLWSWLVRTRWSAYQANEILRGPSPLDAGPMWSFDRFGKSETTLPDSRCVHIGGEHEDYYDPDFFIYNDVTTIDGDGEIAIHGYPVSVFPPTDFHTATLLADAIIVIGNLGYPERRVLGSTPVFRVATDTLSIHRVDTVGESPGWIHKHSAVLADDASAIVVRGGTLWRGDGLSMIDNIDSWSLDLGTCRWTRLTALDWQRWTMLRVDRKMNRLRDVRQELWHRAHVWPGAESHWKFDDAPDFDALTALYQLDEESPMPREGPEYNIFHAVIDGLAVRFTEDRFHVQAVVEGRLREDRLQALQRTLLTTLERLDASRWEIEGL